MPNSAPSRVSNTRRLAGSAALAATAAGVAAVGLRDLHWVEWSLVASAGVLGAAAIGLSRRSVVAQIASRSAAWLVLAPAAMVTVISGLVGHAPDAIAAAFTVGSGAALLLSRPMLHTAEARAEFSPSRFRSWLLAGATASTATGLMAGLIALDFVHRAASAPSFGNAAGAVGFLALTAGLLGSALGVLRLRTWGILLGGLTSFVTLGAAAVMQNPSGLALSLAAMPGLLFFVLPVLVAKRERAHAERAGHARIADHDALALTSTDARARVRVAVDDDPFADEFGDAHEHDEETRSASHPPPAARVQHV